ncbi:MAG: proline dehydrogenase family protein [Chitinophagaceae bacterium]|nr:proline dehydrogenase family protein [Chitinophagaceae bacterium]
MTSFLRRYKEDHARELINFLEVCLALWNFGHQILMISFDNTEQAFAYKTTPELKKARFLFGIMGKPALLKIGLKLLPVAVKYNLPFTSPLIKKTLFSQFVGGESLQETAGAAARLARFNVQVILDYAVEGGSEGEAGFDHATEEFIRVVDYASTQTNIPFMSIKVTGIARFALMEKLDAFMKQGESTLMKNYTFGLDQLPPSEKEEWLRVVGRLQKICNRAAEKNVGMLIDAEDSWIQDPVDAATLLMMDSYNKDKAIVFNTLQLYRHDRLSFLQSSITAARERNFILGAKLVRGAYMEKERARALEKGYPSPIQLNKEATDKDFDAAVKYCVNNIDQVSLIVASHNEQSNLLTTQLMDEKGLAHNHPHIHFSQLYGMSDNITFNLAKAGFGVSKYLPFGPIKDVVPYLMRRAEENSSVSGQTGRELGLIHKELKRRRN